MSKNGKITTNGGGYIIDKIEDLSNKLIKKVYEKDKKNCLKSRISRFVNNESNSIKREFLFNVVENISWYNTKDINDYLLYIIESQDLYSAYYLYFDEKNTFSGSTQRILSMLASGGIIEQEQIVELGNLKNTINDNYEKIVIIDDYIGSGEKTMKFIETIEKEFSDFEVVILCYVCQDDAFVKINSYIKSLNNNYQLIFSKKIMRYDQIIGDNNLKSYIDSVCNHCPEKEYSFGKNDTGALLAIGGISPNNNISLIWYSNIRYNDKRWVPFLNRNLTIESLAQKNKNMIKKGKIIWIREYKKGNYNGKISQDEFEILLLVFNCFATIAEIVEFGYYDTVEQAKNKLDNLCKNKFIEIKNGYINIISKKLLIYLEHVTKILYNNSTKKKNNNQVSSNGKKMKDYEIAGICDLNM